MTPEGGSGDASDDGSVISDPAALIRVANMLQMLTIEVHELPLDDAGRRRLFDVQHRAVDAIRSLVSHDLGAELSSLGLPLEDVGASESELRIAQAQIVGWLNGLFQGIQAAMSARQMVSVEQLQELQRQLGPGVQPTPPGQYL